MATLVHRLRIITRLEDTQALQSRVAAQLRASDLSPAGLPPGAKLVIRRLGDGLPPWRVERWGMRPPTAWQAAVSEKLAELLRCAVRVRGGAIPDDAETILFLDDADLLYQMAADWLGGALPSRWCWRSLYPLEEPAGALVRAWVETPQCVPAAIDRLTVAGQTELFLSRLPDAVVGSILRSVVRVFGLRHMAAALPDDPPAPRAILRAIALTLKRAPHHARSALFARQVCATLDRGNTAATEAATSQPIDAAAKAPDGSGQAPARERIALDREIEIPAPLVGHVFDSGRAIPDTPASGRSEGIEIQTAFGGIFYLINLAIYLGYYGDFSTPQEPGIDLPVWDFLAQTGRELVGERLLKDPVWRLLESLGERERWVQLDEAMVRIRDWLAKKLGVREQPGRFVIEHAARVTLTDTRLDIFLSLDELPVEIRIARLDRDPGWVPAAGRHVAFHFL